MAPTNCMSCSWTTVGARLLGTELAEILHCIRCGACLNVCPVYQSVGGHAYGTVYMGPVGSVLTPALRGLGAFGELPHASSLCGACREICPVRIDIPRMLLALRAQGARERRGPAWITLGLGLYARLARHPRLFGAAARIGRRLIATRARDGWVEIDAGRPRRVDGAARLSTSSREELPAAVARAPDAIVMSDRATVMGNIIANLRRARGVAHVSAADSSAPRQVTSRGPSGRRTCSWSASAPS